MRTPVVPREWVAQLILRLKRQGVSYADVRYEHLLHESLIVEDGQVHAIHMDESAGIGVRVLHSGSWGFASTSQLTPKDLTRAANQAIALAKAVSAMNRVPRSLAPVAPLSARTFSPCKKDPFAVPLENKIDLLLSADEALRGSKKVRHTSSHMDFHQRHKYFVSTEGASLEQRITESGAGLEVIVQADSEVQTRSFPNSHHGALAQAGYEYVESLDLIEGAKTARTEAIALLSAKPPRSGTTTIVLHPTQVAMQLHESCGHPTELDRALGHELSYAGGSFLTPDQLGQKQYGSSKVTIIADATVPGGVGSMAFDDEGVPAQRVELIRKGLFVNYLSSRETAAQIGRTSGGAMRAESWNVPPLIRMTNVNLEPGEGTLDELIRDIPHGYLLATNKSWSIDDQRLNFQFTTEIGWEIIKGRLGAVVKNPLYTGITPEFWGRCTAVGRKEDWQLWGVSNCGKGEPVQLMHVGHGAPYARFDGVTIGAAR